MRQPQVIESTESVNDGLFRTIGPIDFSCEREYVKRQRLLAMGLTFELLYGMTPALKVEHPCYPEAEPVKLIKPY